MRKLVPAVALLLAAVPSGAAAQATVEATMTCPIGGGEFRYATPAAPPALGARPDGKPIGAQAYPPPLPECPDNGLVLYKDYDAAEVARLEPLVASEAYQALRRDDNSYYRAYWLMREMGLEAKDYLFVLLQAAWQADAAPELRARYLSEFAEAAAKLEPRPADINWIGMEGRAINALRELGRFDEAAARLAGVPLDGLQGAAAPADGDEGAAARQARARAAWRAYFDGLKIAIAREDASLEPLELLPRRVAIARCADAGDEAGRAFCDGEAEAVAELRAARAKEAAELEALKKSREQSGR